MGRLHAVRLGPFPTLPHGLLIVSIYAPLQEHGQATLRERFVNAFQEFSHVLDMQVPTLLVGDFNGSLNPACDFAHTSTQRRHPCPLLSHLLGPGGAWLDVHAALLPPPLPWTYQNTDSQGTVSASRIDLILANHAAFPYLTNPRVLTHISDGGHMPVAVDIQLGCSVRIDWHPPRPRLPPLLRLPSSALRSSPEWNDLMDRWLRSPEVMLLFGPSPPTSADTLSKAMQAALQCLITLAGGWQRRPPQRRLAFDSIAVRRLRHRLSLLQRLLSLITPAATSPSPPVGSWPHQWLMLLADLQRAGLSLPTPSLSVSDLLSSLRSAAQVDRCSLDRLLSEMRKERHLRWKTTLPSLWHTRPGVINQWLHATGASWGSVPILDADGFQCTSPCAIDTAVRLFWVDTILRQHASVDPAACWAAFSASRFGPHIPCGLSWPHLPWSASRISAILATMSEGSAPGHFGLPISIWRSLPEAWMTSMARLFTLVETSGQWPSEWLDAYVTMIPKASGGSRPRDQRPITVLEVLYRIWSKGVVLEWGPVLQSEFLGPAAMGFRAGSGTLHLAQLLSDLIALQSQRRQPIWLASFDVEKCFDSLPWWAVFGTLRHAGVRPSLVACFEAFYGAVRRRFRYGAVEGAVWQAANGLAQGCPASPDLLNFLFEGFHRWALAAGYGIDVGPVRVPSASFADDLALIASSLADIEALIAAYLEWCGLLGVKVTKVQVWCNQGPGKVVKVGEGTVSTSSTFRIVGVVLGCSEALCSAAHFGPRLEKALATARRLQTLELPASVLALLWRSAVLSQALYGCEVRTLRPAQVAPLTQLGKALACPKPPLNLNVWRAPEVVCGLPLGDSSVKDPMLEVLERRLSWVHLVANLPSLAGTVHRAVACPSATWSEPTPSLSSALQTMGWSLQPNPLCGRSSAWPMLLPEPRFSGSVALHPVDSFPPEGAVFTDGSVLRSGGSAAVRPDTDTILLACVPHPRSSTHCELAALCLALDLNPSHILTDSLCSLQLISGWGRWSSARMLRCPDRVEVRRFLSRTPSSPPLSLEKVTAHDDAAVRLGHPKAVGNALADASARRAASEPGLPVWAGDEGLFGDPVKVFSGGGEVIQDVLAGLCEFWWRRRLASRSVRREWLDLLYPSTVSIDWVASSWIFRRPIVSGGAFIHPASPSIIKWIARVRAGCLNTRARLHHRQLSSSPACLCCGMELEDDSHVLAGCSVTGSSDWLIVLVECWNAVATQVAPSPSPPPTPWLEQHRLQLLAALIPSDISSLLPLPQHHQPPFVAIFITL